MGPGIETIRNRRHVYEDRKADAAMHVRARALGSPARPPFPKHQARRRLRLFLLARDALARALASIGTHPGAGHFLDLALRTASIIDLDALTQPQIDDVLLAPHLIHHRMRGRCA